MNYNFYYEDLEKNNQKNLKIMLEFKVNDYITLKLENNQSKIYVKDKLFNQCKFLLLEILVDEITSFDEIDSIDEVAEKLDHSLEPRYDQVKKIPPEVKFWGHCSNLQVWVENDYNTRLIHRNLAFPLLQKLVDIGDPVAKKVFKREIVKRFSNGHLPVVEYLIIEGYLDYLNSKEIKSLLLDNMVKLKKLILKSLKDSIYSKNYENSILFKLTKMNCSWAKIIINLLNSDSVKYLLKLLRETESEVEYADILNSFEKLGEKLIGPFIDDVLINENAYNYNWDSAYEDLYWILFKSLGEKQIIKLLTDSESNLIERMIKKYENSSNYFSIESFFYCLYQFLNKRYANQIHEMLTEDLKKEILNMYICEVADSAFCEEKEMALKILMKINDKSIIIKFFGLLDKYVCITYLKLLKVKINKLNNKKINGLIEPIGKIYILAWEMRKYRNSKKTLITHKYPIERLFTNFKDLFRKIISRLDSQNNDFWIEKLIEFLNMIINLSLIISDEMQNILSHNYKEEFDEILDSTSNDAIHIALSIIEDCFYEAFGEIISCNFKKQALEIIYYDHRNIEWKNVYFNFQTD